MATAATLFSAGKDSALAALLLDPVYDVVLCHCTFGTDGTGTDGAGTDGKAADVPAPVRTAADALGFPVVGVALDPAVAREAVERMVADGYPRNGIQLVHEHALETVAARETVAVREMDAGRGSVGVDRRSRDADRGSAGVDRRIDAVADGTRRDDRVPAVERSFAQSLEDRHGVEYVRPLAGYGRGAVDDLAERLLVVETGPSESLATGDYEAELRALVAAEYGQAAVDDVFPDHVQSRVVGRRDG